MTREDGPCYVEFETRDVEDREASLKEGHYVPRDVDFIIVTPPGGNLTVEKEVGAFLKDKKASGDPHVETYERAYKAWKEGQEIPLEGTPIRSWPVISPAQIKSCLNANIRTVEDLATAPDDALQRIGMGSRGLQQKAEAWLQSAHDSGKTTEELSTLRRDNADLKEQVESLRKKVEELTPEKPKRKKAA